MKRSRSRLNIKCELCGGNFRRITNTHLWIKHQITIEEYRLRFSTSPIDAPGLAYSRVAHLRGKSYEEVYGKGQAEYLKEQRSKKAKLQMKDSKQIEIRREKSGHKPSEEQRMKLREQHTVHGANNYRRRALDFYGLECMRCGYSSESEKEFVVHHKDFLNINSELGNHSIENLQVLCRPCHSKLHNALCSTSAKFVGLSNIEKGVHYIFKGLKDNFGLDLKNEHFKDTPKRIARAYVEIFEGVRDTKKQVKEILGTSFTSELDEIILAKGIQVYSMCPHHLLPVEYYIHVAYIPTKGGRVLGVSKLSRLVQVLARRPVIQEQFSQDITKYLMTLEKCQGAACIVEGKHYCMIMRGIKQSNSKVITSSMKGVFMTDPSAKSELMELIGR